MWQKYLTKIPKGGGAGLLSSSFCTSWEVQKEGWSDCAIHSEGMTAEEEAEKTWTGTGSGSNLQSPVCRDLRPSDRSQVPKVSQPTKTARPVRNPIFKRVGLWETFLTHTGKLSFWSSAHMEGGSPFHAVVQDGSPHC